MIHGVLGRPFVDLSSLLDLSELDAIHEEVCLGLANVRRLAQAMFADQAAHVRHGHGKDNRADRQHGQQLDQVEAPHAYGWLGPDAVLPPCRAGSLALHGQQPSAGPLAPCSPSLRMLRVPQSGSRNVASTRPVPGSARSSMQRSMVCPVQACPRSS